MAAPCAQALAKEGPQQRRRSLSEEVLLGAGAAHAPLFCGGCCRCQHVQAGACSVQMESLKNLADKLLNVFTELVLIENFQRFIAWPNVGGFSKRWQKAHPQEQGHPFSKCYASVPKHALLN